MYFENLASPITSLSQTYQSQIWRLFPNVKDSSSITLPLLFFKTQWSLGSLIFLMVFHKPHLCHPRDTTIWLFFLLFFLSSNKKRKRTKEKGQYRSWQFVMHQLNLQVTGKGKGMEEEIFIYLFHLPKKNRYNIAQMNKNVLR